MSRCLCVSEGVAADSCAAAGGGGPAEGQPSGVSRPEQSLCRGPARLLVAPLTVQKLSAPITCLALLGSTDFSAVPCKRYRCLIQVSCCCPASNLLWASSSSTSSVSNSCLGMYAHVGYVVIRSVFSKGTAPFLDENKRLPFSFWSVSRCQDRLSPLTMSASAEPL